MLPGVGHVQPIVAWTGDLDPFSRGRSDIEAVIARTDYLDAIAGRIADVDPMAADIATGIANS